MTKKLVRIARNVLDIEKMESDNRRLQVIEKAEQPLKLDSLDSSVAPPIASLAAIEDFLRKKRLNWQPDSQCDNLKSKIAEYVRLSEDFISCFASADLALNAITRTYLEGGSKALNVSSGPNSFTYHCLSNGADSIIVAFDDPFEFSIETVINNICPRTRMIYLSNPDILTGATLTEAELIFLLAYAENAMVVVDESLVEYYGRSAAELTNRFANLTIIRTFSSIFGLASLGTSYIITDPDNLEFIQRLSSGMYPDALAQSASAAALCDLNHIRQNYISTGQSKKILAQNLPLLGFEFHIGSGNSFLLKVDDPFELVDMLEQEEIYISSINLTGKLAGFARISIGNPIQTDRLLGALGKFKENSLRDENSPKNAGASRIADKMKIEVPA
jgi:histidinol-phosphate aminotransferase